VFGEDNEELKRAVVDIVQDSRPEKIVYTVLELRNAARGQRTLLNWNRELNIQEMPYYLRIPRKINEEALRLARELSRFEDVLMVKEVAGSRVFWKEMGVNTLIYLLPGEAYYVYCTAATSVTYPFTSDEAWPQEKPQEINGSPFDVTLPTPSSHVTVFNANALAAFEPGDVIGAGDAYGNCMGQSCVEDQDQAVSLVIYGDDPLTAETDGMTAGGMIAYTLYRPANHTFYDLNMTFDADHNDGNTFTDNGISVVTGVTLSPTGIGSSYAGGVKIYPNPTAGMLHIAGVKGKYRAVVFNAVQEKVFEAALSDNGTLDLSALPKGIYLIRIQSPAISLTMKFVID